MSDSCLLPDFDQDTAAALAASLFGLGGALRQLDGERDLNFLIGDPGRRHVFKIANAGESRAFLQCQHEIFERLARQAVFAQSTLARTSQNGNRIETLRSAGGQTHLCRALPYVEGRLLADVESPSPALLNQLGQALARLDRALDGYRHAALDRPLLWHMDRGLDVIAGFKPLIRDSHRRGLVARVEAQFRTNSAPRLARMRRALIHNDANRANVLVDDAAARVIGVIDFGDMVESPLVVEPAIAATYTMLDREDPLAAAASLLRGYHDVLPLTGDEIALVPALIRLRASMSVCINAHQAALQPDNDYLAIDSDALWALLEQIAETDESEALAAISPR